MTPDQEDVEKGPFSTINRADRMLSIYAEITALEDARRASRERERALRNEIVEALGVRVGSEIEQKGERYLVRKVYGDFEFEPADDGKIWAAVRCDVAPATANGFHATKTVSRIVFDTHGFPSPHPQPIEDEAVGGPAPGA